MIERSVTIRNKAGIHCRPSGVILNAVRDEFPGHRFLLAAKGEEIELDSMLDLLSLGLGRGDTALLKVEGANAEKALKRIGDLFEYEFDFPPRS
jgi:phosphocarrier protein